MNGLSGYQTTPMPYRGCSASYAAHVGSVERVEAGELKEFVEFVARQVHLFADAAGPVPLVE